MAKQQFKYNLKLFITSLPGVWNVDKIAKEVEKAGIPRRTFDSDKSIKQNEARDIPGERLFIYASLFDCSIEQLMNFTDKRIKPLNKRKLSIDVQKMLEKNNLKFDQ